MSYGVRVGMSQFTLDGDANSSTAPSNTDHGVEVPDRRRHKDVLVGVGKTNSCDLEIWGYPEGGQPGWGIADVLQLTEEDIEYQRYEGLSGFERVAIRRVDTNVQNGMDDSAINAFFGFSEA